MANLETRIAGLSPRKQQILLRRLAADRKKSSPPCGIDKRPGEGSPPLSFAQERMWLLERLEAGLYNNLDVVRLKGRLDQGILQRCLSALVRRHEILRTTFPERNGSPAQVIGQPQPAAVLHAELRGLDSGRRKAEARRLVQQLTMRAFDLGRGPLMRVALLGLARNDHVFVRVIHHILCDAWSDGIFFRELATLYQAFSAGMPDPLPDLPIQYGDYAYWQRRRFQGEYLQRQLAYWKNRLQGDLAALQLPLDRTRGAQQTFRGARQPLAIPAALSDRLFEEGRGQGATPFMTLLAAFLALLHRLSGAPQVRVGTPVADRDRPATANLIGPFLNTLVLNTSFRGDPSGQGLLRQVSKATAEAFAHRDLPFERLVEEIQPRRDLSRTPLFQVLFTLDNNPPKPASFPGLQAERFDVGEVTARFDLTLWMTQAASGLVGLLEYNADLFDATTAQRMIRQFQMLCEGLAGDPARRISDLPLLDAAARQQILIEWDDTRSEMSAAPIHQLVCSRAGQCPDAVSICCGGRQLTFHELERRSAGLARRLAAAGVAKEAPVGIFVERGLDLVLNLLGVLKSGAAYVPLDPAFPAQRLAWMLEDCRMPVVLTQPSLAGRLPAGSALLMVPDPSAMQQAKRPQPQLASIDGDQLAYVIFTSGSTGRPKGVQVTHRAAVNLLLSMQRKLSLTPRDALVAVTTLSFDISLPEILLPLLAGGRLVLADQATAADGAALAGLLASSRATVMQATPATWQMLLEAGWQGLSGFQAGAGGEALSSSLARRLSAACRILWNFYGPTETTVWSSIERVRETGSAPSLGRPIANTRIVLLDRRMHPAPVGVAAEVLIGGLGVARGYLGRPGLTAERFVPNPFSRTPGRRLYRTGDLGRLLADGRLAYLGRADHQVKVRGFRIELGEVESNLARCPGVREAAAAVYDAGAGDRRLVAYLSAPQERPSTADIRRTLAEALPPYMIPASFVFLDALPRTPNGKVDRRALPAPDRQRLDSPAAVTAPRDPVEEWVAEAWSGILGLEGLGVHDNLFEVGAHSLLAVRFVSKATEAFGIELPLRTVFQAPTVAGLSAVVRESRQGASTRPASTPAAIRPDRAGRGRPFALTDLQQAYWIGAGNAFELGNISAHIYREGDVDSLDAALLEKAWRRLVERHDMLRAIVLANGRQQVLENVPDYRIEVLDLRGRPEQEARRELGRLRRRLTRNGPAMDRWPLFELRVSILPDSRYRIHFSISLVICDAWSHRLLTEELLRVARGEEGQLPELEITFRDFVEAAQEFRQSEAYRQSLHYWQARLADLPAAPELPLLRDPSAVSRPVFQRRYGRLEPQAWRRLKERSLKLNATPTGLLCTAFAEVLATWSKGSRFLLNSLFFNRPPWHPQIERIVGNFSSTILIEIDFSQPLSFEQRVRKVQQQIWDDLEHSQVTGVQVLRELSRLKGGRARPAMPVVFSSTLGFGDPAGQAPPGSAPPKTGYNSLQTPQIWLDHQVSEWAGGLSFNWDVVEELFPAGLIDDMFAAYCGLLERLGSSQEAWQGSGHPLLPALQQKQRRAINATTGLAPSGLLQEGFAEQADRRPHQPAVITARQTLSYGELLKIASRLGRELQRQGASPGSLVAVVMEKGWEQVAAVLGILLSGAAYLPIDPNLPEERIHYLLANGKVRQALTQARVEVNWPQGLRRLVVDRAGSEDASLPAPQPAQKPDDLAYVIYTSGSTGMPKGVMIDHLGALNTIVDINQRLGFTSRDRVLALSSLSFDLSVYDIFGPLTAGGALVIPEAGALREPAVWEELVREFRVSVWNSVPALMEMLVDHLEGRSAGLPDCLRMVMMSGDWIPVSLPGRIRALSGQAEVLSLGGATEASIWSIAYPVRQVDPGWASIPYGKPLRHQQFHVLDERLQPRPTWVAGQLHIGGRGVAKGYWQDPERTGKAFIRHPRSGERLYRTGDLGRYLPDGNIEFLGREDNQVKVQGHRIELGEIESALLQHPSVSAAVAAASGPDRSHKRLVAYVVPASGQPCDADDLKAFLGQKLPAYMVPPAWIFLDALPLSANGKVDRGALPAPEAARAGRGRGLAQPRDALELELVRIWQDLLEVDRLGIRDNFFELGGHSLLAVRLMARLQKRFHRELPISTLFRQGTVEELAGLLRQEAPDRPRSALVAIQPQGERPPFFCVHPVGGSVLCYAGLARRLGREQPFFGLERVDEEDPEELSLEAMAGRYIDEVGRVQPAGPYRLGGWSMGGVVAFEMACQLQAEGRPVALVALLDSVLPDAQPDSERVEDTTLAAWFVQDLAALTGRPLESGLACPECTDQEQQLDWVLDRVRKAEAVPADMTRRRIGRYLKRFNANYRALLDYRPGRYAGRLALLQARGGPCQERQLERWRSVCDGLSAESLPGDHYTMMQEEGVEKLAARLECLLQEARQPEGDLSHP